MTRNEKIIAAVKAGRSYGQIARALGLSRSTVAGVVSRSKREIKSSSHRERQLKRYERPGERERCSPAARQASRHRWGNKAA